MFRRATLRFDYAFMPLIYFAATTPFIALLAAASYMAAAARCCHKRFLPLMPPC